MDISPSQLTLKRPINVKAVVTPRWKDEIQQQLQGQINQVDGQLQQLDMQGQRAISEIQKQSLQPPGPQTLQQIESIQIQVNEKKSELLEQKNQSLNISPDFFDYAITQENFYLHFANQVVSRLNAKQPFKLKLVNFLIHF